MRLKPGADIAAVLASVAPGASSNAVHGLLNMHRVQLPPGLVDRVAGLLAALPSVDYVEPNRVRHSDVTAPNDPNYSSQWGLTALNAVEAWNLLPGRYLTAATAGGQRIKVAVLDTGIDCTHSDFRNAGGSSADATQGGQLDFSLSHAYAASTISSTVCTVMDDNGHGTHVAGTIAAATQNGAGVASVAWPVVVVSYKVLDKSGSGFDSVIAQAIMAAADAGIPVVSMSLGGAGYSQALQDAVNYAWARNTLVVAAAGNSSTSSLFFPAGANHVVGVSATDSAGNLASFSNFGNSVDVAAPGVGILSTAPSYSGTQLGALNYASFSGTSMATPHVSAVAALIAMATPGAPPAAVAQRLQQTAASKDAAGGWTSSFGYGVVNARNAVASIVHPSTSGGITGQVVDASGYPVNGATIAAGGTSMTTAFDGLFRLSRLAPGTYQLSASAAGYPSILVSAAVPAGADVNLTVQLGVPLGTFAGTVVAGGLPVAGAVVQALSGAVAIGTATTDANGIYSLAVAAGTYSLRASALGATSSTASGQSVAAGGTAAVNLTVSRLGTIAGVVRDGSSTPVAGATVTVSGPESAGAITNSNGNFQTIGLAAGSYTVSATAAGKPDASVSGVQVVNGAATPVTITMGAPPPPPPPSFTPVRVNAGGPAYTDGAGQAWSADSGFIGGSVWSITQPIANTADSKLYQTCRYGTAFSYQFTAPNGTYTVNLKFAEVSMTGPGQRVFNAAINGTAVLSNFDIFAQAGGARIAIDKPFQVNVTTGQIAIQFTSGGANAPMVNAIEIVPAGGAATVSVSVSPSSATLTAGASQQFTASVTGNTNTAVTWSISPAGVGSVSASGVYTAPSTVTSQQNVTVTATSVADPTKSAGALVTLMPPVASFTPIRINAGGPAYSDGQNNVWSADTGYAGGLLWTAVKPIANTADPTLYQTVRYGHGFSYQFAVPNGSYHVNLKFAEVSATGPGQRVFNVAVNGAAALSNFDIYAQAGGALIAIDKQIPVAVTNGLVTIQFTDGPANAPMINAIEIVP